MSQNKSVEEVVEEFKKLCALDIEKGGWNIPYEGIYERKAEDWLRTTLMERDQTSQEREREIVEAVMPYLKGYLNALDTDWSVNPVQATTLAYIPPEQVLRNSANEIEAKRERARQLRKLIDTLTNPNED